jgi:hypothetical protein
MRQDEYQAAVAEYIRKKGITRCPTACAVPTQGTIGAADRVALEQYAAEHQSERREVAIWAWSFKGPQGPGWAR